AAEQSRPERDDERFVRFREDDQLVAGFHAGRLQRAEHRERACPELVEAEDAFVALAADEADRPVLVPGRRQDVRQALVHGHRDPPAVSGASRMSEPARRLMPSCSAGVRASARDKTNRGARMPRWIFISRNAKYSPRQRRGPSENGKYGRSPLATDPSDVKRSGSNTSGSGQ